MNHTDRDRDIWLINQLERLRSYMKFYEQKIRSQQTPCIKKGRHLIELICKEKFVGKKKQSVLEEFYGKHILRLLQSHQHIFSLYKEDQEVIKKFRGRIAIKENEIGELANKIQQWGQQTHIKEGKQGIKKTKWLNLVQQRDFTDSKQLNEPISSGSDDESSKKRGPSKQYQLQEESSDNSENLQQLSISSSNLSSIEEVSS